MLPGRFDQSSSHIQSPGPGSQNLLFGRRRLAAAPADARALQLYGTALLCGMGFIMSPFIRLLAPPACPEMQVAVKIGVIVGSVLPGVFGAGVFAFAARSRRSVKV